MARLTGNEIRKSFLDYFSRRGHTAVKSSSLVPEKDPTLLFTNAGMVQFKNVFLGLERLPYVRAASAQKCLRISGKHNDLEAVGRDTYHHTFFEMLGNWSFGDYYKEEAIAWAWELLTKEWDISKERLWATVFSDDGEAEELWRRIGGLSPDRILRFGEKENFWEMAETGPCGPCSEIHIDRGAEGCDHKGVKGHRCRVNGDCARYMELWNLVFIQYNRKEDRSLEDLPSKHVDTGMGLERVTAVMQGVLSNYDVDFMRDLIAHAEKLTGRRYGADADADVSFRVIADHVRAISFLIADGVTPGNEGRGYVLRRLLRRAARHGRLIGLTEPYLHQISATVAGIMGDAYPELQSEKDRIQEAIRLEEERFAETLEKGLGLLEEAVAELNRKKKKVLPGEVAFRLYDTYGFPVDLTEDILRSQGISVDQADFERLMEEQRSRGRESRSPQTIFVPFVPGISSSAASQSLDSLGLSPCEFVGYDRIDAESEVLGLFVQGQGKAEVSEGEEVDVITAQTPFYGESGGQVGDRGRIETSRGDLMEVVDTQHPTPQLTVHRGRVKRGCLQVGDRIHLVVDPRHRQRTKLNHSATHILHAVLREKLGQHVRQAGSLVAPDRLRFDFSHTGPIAPEILAEIETTTNERIRLNALVKIEESTFDEAVRRGALAFFGEKYGDRVRVVRIGDFSTELCGGTHVHQTGEIGVLKIRTEAGVAAGVRRVEAVTGEGAFDLIRRYEHTLREIGDLLRATPEDSAERVKRLLQQQRDLQREIEKLQSQVGRDQMTRFRPKEYNGIKAIVEKVEKADVKQLREMADHLKKEIGSGVVFLVSAGEGNVTMVSSVSPDLTSRYHAGNIVKEVAPIVGGGGGGRPDFAQAGGKDPSKIDAALDRVREIIQKPMN